MHKKISIQRDDFDIGREWSELRTCLGGEVGAMAAFCGVVRDQFETHTVSNLELEHYPGMTENSIESILDRAAVRWPLDATVVIHRIGSLAPRDQIVLVLTVSSHRQAALDACTFVIDLLKTEAVFWKREVLPAGARWIESTSVDQLRSTDWRK